MSNDLSQSHSWQVIGRSLRLHCEHRVFLSCFKQSMRKSLLRVWNVLYSFLFLCGCPPLSVSWHRCRCRCRLCRCFSGSCLCQLTMSAGWSTPVIVLLIEIRQLKTENWEGDQERSHNAARAIGCVVKHRAGDQTTRGLSTETYFIEWLWKLVFKCT